MHQFGFIDAHLFSSILRIKLIHARMHNKCFNTPQIMLIYLLIRRLIFLNFKQLATLLKFSAADHPELTPIKSPRLHEKTVQLRLMHFAIVPMSYMQIFMDQCSCPFILQTNVCFQCEISDHNNNVTVCFIGVEVGQGRIFQLSPELC